MSYEKMTVEELTGESQKLKGEMLKLKAEREKISKVLSDRSVKMNMKRKVEKMSEPEREAMRIELEGFKADVKTGNVGI
jgi:hypothetical protein